MHFYIVFLTFFVISCASPASLSNLSMDLPQGDLRLQDTGNPTKDTIIKDANKDILPDDSDGVQIPDKDVIPDLFDSGDYRDAHQSGTYPLRQCKVTLKFSAPQGTTTVNIPGEWNKWDKTAAPMQKDANGMFTRTFTGNDEIPPGEWAYKFLENGTNWVLDPLNPLGKWVNGIENSKLIMPDCDKPVIALDNVQTDAKNLHIHINFSVFRGLNEQKIDKITVKQADDPVDFTIDSKGKGVVDFDASDKGKYLFMITAESDSKRAQLFVPVWVQDNAFSWKDAIIYFPMTDRFMDGDTSNDSPADCLDPGNKANWLGGDFAGLKQKLDAGYFNDLGINTLWLGPVWNNPDGCYAGAVGHTYTAYHGYFPMDYSSIEEHYGTMTELKELISDAHTHGIRVIADLPANHVFQDSKIFSAHRDWFHNGKVGETPLICSDDDNWNTHPVECWFQPYLPDFDYTNNDAVDFVTDTAVDFVQKTGIDGFRIDAVKHMVPNFVKTLRYKIRHEVETSELAFYMVGETFVGEWGHGTGKAEELIKSYVSKDRLDGQFDFPLYWAIIKTFARDEQTFGDLADELTGEQGYYGQDAIMSNFVGNHDVPRFISHAAGVIADQWGNGSKQQGWNTPPSLPTEKEAYQRLSCAFAFVMCIPGVPMVYYGDEIAMPGAGDPDNRRMMQFDGLTDRQKAVKSALSLEAAFRKVHPATRIGTPVVLDKGDDFLGLGMKGTNESVVCVFNRNSTRDISLSLQDLPGLKDVAKITDRLSGKQYKVNNGKLNIHLDGDTCLMMEAQ